MFRGSIETKDKIISSLVYLLPFLDVFPIGIPLMKDFPLVTLIYLPFRPLINFYHSFPFAGLIIFFALFLGVVRNPNVNYFTAFNTLQAILLDLVLVLGGFALQILMNGLGYQNLLVLTVANTIFLGTLTACFYGTIQSARGLKAELPAISNAVSSQIR